ncbi:hypothetical protein TNCV_2739521 [Trichonephila clavipes]|nr:hypothetical protein TNCV_2739521 [Trichonephila clavipes]
MYASSSSINPTPLAHADNQRDVLSRGNTTEQELFEEYGCSLGTIFSTSVWFKIMRSVANSPRFTLKNDTKKQPMKPPSSTLVFFDRTRLKLSA